MEMPDSFAVLLCTIGPFSGTLKYPLWYQNLITLYQYNSMSQRLLILRMFDATIIIEMAKPALVQ